MNNQDYYAITPEIVRLAGLSELGNRIDSDLYAKFDVKRGLRDLNGKGVLAGLTNISDVRANKMVDGKQIPNTVFNPCPVELLRMPSKTAYILSFTYDPACSTEHNTKSPFLIDDIKIWDYAKTDALP